MAGQAVTLHLPDDLYNQLRERAARRQHSIEEEVMEVVATAISQEGAQLPEDLADELAQLAVLDDAALWRVAGNRFSPKAATQLEALHLQRQRDGLSADEDAERARLASQYERAMLLRARAAAILAERGHDVTSLVAQP